MRWSEERISGGKGLVNGRGTRGITLSYARPGRGGGRRTLLVEKAEAKREVGTNSDEII